MVWTDERVEHLKELWADGYSNTEIAGRINDQAGLELVSRMAVGGKIHRLGLSRGPVEGRTRNAHKRKPKQEFGKRRKAVLPATPIPPPKDFDVVRVMAKDLRAKDCRWPIGDPKHAGFGFCGLEKLPGLPYCAAHALRAYQAPVVSSPAPTSQQLEMA